MSKASVIIDRDFVIDKIDPRIYGGFAEHLGRHIYSGMYEPGHPTADENGFRQDVVELVKELSMPAMRYPGGNFVSGYNWEDGVGPRDQRPTRLDLAWKTTETNEFGTNEFIDWCKQVDTEPMLAINLGTRGPDEARNYLEYCNHPGGSYWSDLRRSHGYDEPHNVKLWCLGNEMDGPWQIGHKTATEYGRIAAETARMMRYLDPDLELVVCGSSNRGMPTYGSWEMEVLDHTLEHVDYLSIHSYFGNYDKDTGGYLAWADHMDSFIEECVAYADAVAAKQHSHKRIHLSFDEWNVCGNAMGHPKDAERWAEAPCSHESCYDLEDAIAFAGLMMSLINHADRVKIACLAQVVNVIAPIMTEPGGPTWRQSIFRPFALTSKYGRGTALQTIVESSKYDAPSGKGYDHLKIAAVRGENGPGLNLFLQNRDTEGPLTVDLDLRSFDSGLQPLEWLSLCGDNLQAANTKDAPDTVKIQTLDAPQVANGQLQIQLPATSWNLIRMRG